MKKLILAAGAFSLAISTAALSAQIKADAEQCLIKQSNEQVHTILINHIKPGFKASSEDRGAFNRAMLACEQRHSWQRQQTLDAGAYAGFLLRFRSQEKAFIAHGVSQSQLASLRNMAGYINVGDKSSMTNWLRQNGYSSFSAFKSKTDFQYVDAWIGVLSALKKLETGTL